MSLFELDKHFSADASQIEGKVRQIMQTHRRMSALYSCATGVTYIDRKPTEQPCAYCGTPHNNPSCKQCGAPRTQRQIKQL